MSSRRKASTPCMIRPEQTMVELDDDDEEEPHNMEVLSGKNISFTKLFFLKCVKVKLCKENIDH